MQKFRILIAYNGQRYYGWQKQKKTPTVQGQIEQALKRVFQRDIPVMGAGRTDTGVHALGQNAHFCVEKRLSSRPLEKQLQKALNHLLIPEDICVRQVWRAPQEFHARRQAVGKSYVYLTLNRPYPNVFRKGQIHWYPYPTNIDLLNAMSLRIQGQHDFKSFQNTGTPVKNTIRTVTLARWRRLKKDILAFQIEGEGFLKQMVRNLIGTQLALLREKDPVKTLDRIFQAKDRKAARACAPAEGLYLYRVFYPQELDKKCQKI